MASAVPRPTMPPPMIARSVLCVTAARIPPPSAPRPPSPQRGEGRRRGYEAERLVELERDRAMVRSDHVGQDRGAPHPGPQLVGDEEVVDAPAEITGARSGLEVPPGVAARVGGE